MHDLSNAYHIEWILGESLFLKRNIIWGASRYVMRSRRIDYKDDTRLAVDAEEQRAVQERLNSGNAASTPTYHFICECFFLTAKGLHLGLIKIIQDLYNLARVSQLPTSDHFHFLL